MRDADRPRRERRDRAALLPRRRPASTSLAPGPGRSSSMRRVEHEVELCFALGGDGTILSALRDYAGTGVPVFAVNFGEIGFLATVDTEEAGHGFDQAFAGNFEVLSLPGLALEGGQTWLAINDLSMHRQPGKRVADLSTMRTRRCTWFGWCCWK